ncbi:protein RD3-like [Pteronotus mesoamericanus]|uniref:protein RD3-like n=1 Tax=Pteronotus mesoamericanus TaxID=1884717 RepID=UPI0023EAD15A|nr:protein RD3-like [Pteronotus parnellii mesoamericanus]
MPLFGWTKWPKYNSYRPNRRPGSEAATKMLLRELQWHLKERERRVQEIADEQNGKETGVDDSRLRDRQIPRTAIPATAQGQLEALCAQLRPCQAGAVLSRFREVLAENDVLPWEIVYIFKQVLEDALGSPENGGQPGGLAAGGPAHPACPGDHARSSDKDEIPTISSYVDRKTENRPPASAPSTWDLPQHRPAP